MTGELARPKVVAVIPARFRSSRFPGKPLASIADRPMIAHVIARAFAAESIDEVLVATDDQRIFQAAEAAGARAVMTSAAHQSGTDRVAEAVNESDADVIINVQGDQPLLDPGGLEALVACLADDSEIGVATLAVPLTDDAEWTRPDVVKVVCSGRRAVYFSRSPVPYDQSNQGQRPKAALKHVGVYAFRREVLFAFRDWAPSALEQLESLEQLRLLEHDVAIGVAIGDYETVSVDRPEDVARVESILSSGIAT